MAKTSQWIIQAGDGLVDQANENVGANLGVAGSEIKPYRSNKSYSTYTL